MNNTQRASMLACALDGVLPYAREEAASLENVVRRDGAEEAEFELARANAAIEAAEKLLEGEQQERVYRLLVVHGDVEPELIAGEHESFEAVRAAARAFRRQENTDLPSGCYVITAPRGCLIEVTPFSGADMDDGGDSEFVGRPGVDTVAPSIREEDPRKHKEAYVLFSPKAAKASLSRMMPGSPAPGLGYWSREHGWTRIENADVHEFGPYMDPFPPLPEDVRSETDDAMWIPRSYPRTHTCFYVRVQCSDGVNASRSLWARSAAEASQQTLKDYPGATVIGMTVIA